MLKKVKRRYLAVQMDSHEMFNSKEFMDTVWNAICKLYGEHGASQTSLILINYDQEKKLAIIRCLHTALEMVHASLASITRMADKPAALHVIAVSGTIKGLQKKIRN